MRNRISLLAAILKTPQRLYWYATDSRYRTHIQAKLFRRFGYSEEFWDRIVQTRIWSEFLSGLDRSSMAALEISPGKRDIWRKFEFKSYESVGYPDFDLCETKLDQRFDIIIADNVFEHLLRPYAAAKNVFAMLRDGGYFLAATPFLIKIHGSPYDFTRWTPDGFKELLCECGWRGEDVQTASWGNRKCAEASLRSWPLFGFGKSLENEPEYPVMVWAIARKSDGSV